MCTACIINNTNATPPPRRHHQTLTFIPSGPARCPMLFVPSRVLKEFLSHLVDHMKFPRVKIN